MGTPRTRGDHVEAKPPDVSPSHTKRVARAREGLSEESTGPSGAERARGEARLLLALFSVSLLWISSLSVSEYLVDLVLPPGSTRPTDTAAVADAASLLATHARRAERDNAACALRQTTSCVANVRSDCVSEFRRADDVAARNAKVALLATAVAEACVALDTSVEHALRVVANARAPQDFLWTDTDGTDTEETQTCAARDRGLIRARAAVTDPQKTDDSTGLDTRLYEATVTYRAAANTYRSGADAALLDATSLVKARAAYDEEYAANQTVSLNAARAALSLNVTAELGELARILSDGLSAMDLGAGADLRAIATDTAAALVQTRDEVEATLRTYVKDVRVYAIEVSSKLAAAKTWFDAFSDIGDFVQNLMGDLATSLPSVDAPVPPYLTIAEIYPQIVPDVTGVIDAVTLAASEGADAVARAADQTRLEFVTAAARIPSMFDLPGGISVFQDYRPPPRSTDSGDGGTQDNVAAADAYAVSANAGAETRWSVFSTQVDSAAGALDAERALLNTTRANATGDLEDGFADFESDASDALENADPAGTVATFAADSAARLDAAAANASGAAEWLGVASPDFDALRVARAAASTAADGLVGADLAYRFARSFQHIARHFKGSKHGRLPPVDLTIAAAAAAAGSPRNGKSAFMTAAAAIGHPVCLATVRVSAAVLVVTLITQAYLPFHDAYRNGCVVGCDGTFVTQNIHSFSHNFAAAAATRAAESGKAQVERERHVACAREAPKSAAELARARADVATATANMRRAGQEVARARRCVDFRATRLFFTANDTDTNNTARANASLALAFLEHVDDAEVNMCLGDLTSLNGSENGFGGFANAFALDETSLFDCAVLRPCVSANCAGPRFETLAPLARATGCLAEGAAHASLLRFLLVGALFVAANAMRETVVKGIAALSWRKLTGDDGVSFRGTLTLNGEVELGSRSSGNVRAKLVATARAHELRGLGKVVLALVAQVPGLVALWYARNASLAPKFTCDT